MFEKKFKVNALCGISMRVSKVFLKIWKEGSSALNLQWVVGFCCLLIYVNTLEKQNYVRVTANPGFRGQLAIFQF